MAENVQLDLIRLDGGTQPRGTMSDYVVDEYKEAMLEGAEFPPVEIIYDGQDHWLVDGFHRFWAAKHGGRAEILANITPGTYRDALLASVGANATHGLRRTNLDKERAVKRLLDDTEWGKWADREIARVCNVSHTFVARLRKERAPTGNVASSEERTYKRGGQVQTMKTGNIGKSQEDDAAAREASDQVHRAWFEKYVPSGIMSTLFAVGENHQVLCTFGPHANRLSEALRISYSTCKTPLANFTAYIKLSRLHAPTMQRLSELSNVEIVETDDPFLKGLVDQLTTKEVKGTPEPSPETDPDSTPDEQEPDDDSGLPDWLNDDPRGPGIIEAARALLFDLKLWQDKLAFHCEKLDSYSERYILSKVGRFSEHNLKGMLDALSLIVGNPTAVESLVETLADCEQNTWDKVVSDWLWDNRPGRPDPDPAPEEQTPEGQLI